MTGSVPNSQLPRLVAWPLRAGERLALAAALRKAELPVDDLEAPDRLFWRFESSDDIPVGFGGLEPHGEDALLRSLVTLPPMRRRGIGSAMVRELETEARLRGCRAIWLMTTTAAAFFAARGYRPCDRAAVPAGIRGTQEFAALCPASAQVMTKRLD